MIGEQVANAVFGVFGIVMVFLIAILIYALEKIVRVADRYRMKYGYDMEIEGKEFDPDSLAKRKKRFEKRVFRD